MIQRKSLNNILNKSFTSLYSQTGIEGFFYFGFTLHNNVYVKIQFLKLSTFL